MIDYGTDAKHAAAVAVKAAKVSAVNRAAALEIWRAAIDARREGAGDGRWALNRGDPDVPFSRPGLSDRALTAAVWTTARFDKSFPGWQLYRRIMVGFDGFDAELLEWATSCAWALARAKTRNGRDYLRADARGPWIAFAAADALHCAIFGRYPSGADGNGAIHGVRLATYRKVRDPVAGGLILGLESFRSELHYQYHRAAKAQIDEGDGNLKRDGAFIARFFNIHSGNRRAFPARDSDRMHEPKMPNVLTDSYPRT